MTYGPLPHNPQHPVVEPGSVEHWVWSAEQRSKRLKAVEAARAWREAHPVVPRSDT